MQSTSYDPRFAPIANPDGTVNLIELGRIEHKHRDDPCSLTDTERACRDAMVADPLAARVFTSAAIAYQDHSEAKVRADGGVIVSEVSRTGSDGRHTVTRTVRRYPPRRLARMAAITAPRGARRESHRSRPGHRRAASSSTSSAADPPGPDLPAAVAVRWVRS